MLYDWYSWDSTAGKYVYQMADDDLLRLSQNGYNLVHLYLWDKDSLISANANEPAGFASSPSNPALLPGTTTTAPQWTALNEFVNAAKNRGLYVALHFVSGRLLNQISSGIDPNTSSAEFASWAGAFVQYLTPAHNNIVMWGVAYALGPAPGQPLNIYSVTFAKCYKKVDDIVRAQSPSTAGILGLIGANLAFELLNGSAPLVNNVIIPRGSAYAWDWQTAQKRVKTMRDALTAEYGFTKDPDLYMIQPYNANSWDLNAGLTSLSTGSVSDGLAPSVAKLFVVEIATSSSLDSTIAAVSSSSRANNVPSWGDWQTPTTTVSGQVQWLNNTLCTFSALGIQKMAYWSMYDPYTMWATYPWQLSGQDLSWNAFWGLIYESESDGDKPSWTALKNYYQSGTLSCSGTPSGATPIVALLTSSNYYTQAQPIRAIYNAADSDSLGLNSSHGSSYSCAASQTSPLSSSLVGSCGYVDADPTYYSGSRSLVLTGYNGLGGTQFSSATVTVGEAPILAAITNSSYSTTVHANDVAIFWTNGLSLSGGNTVQLVRSGYPDVWLYNGDGHYFFDQSHFQINSALDGRAAPGVWNVYVRSPYSGTPSAAFSLTILP